MVPMCTRESWDFIRRYPTFYAFNPNNKSYTKLDMTKTDNSLGGKVISKFNEFNFENVCVIFRDISYGVIETEDGVRTKSQDSLQYFLKKAMIKEGLEVSGMRMIYLDDEQRELYYHLFNERLASKNDTYFETHALLAVMLRGVEAIARVEKIVGHFNPDTARKTNEKSVRSFFGKDKDHNCVLKMFAS